MNRIIFQLIMQNNCQQFCGCQQYLQTQPVNIKVYICFFLILIIVMIALRIGTEWFIYKDYYPLKQKSPLLCIVMIAFITLQILLYPLLYIYNYFTRSFDRSEYIYRMFYYGLDGTIYFIYVLRSLRLVYAHTTDPSRQKTWIFHMFKYEYLLGCLSIVLMFLRMITIYFNPSQQYKFYTMIEFSTPFSRKDQVPFLSKSIMIEFIWLLILIYCLKIQSLAHPKHSMKNQLILIISTNIILSTVDLILISDQVGQSSLFFGLCSNFEGYPSVQITKSVSLIIMFLYTALYPLRLKKVYHMLLPTGRNYGLTKTMRDFLLEPEFLDIFSRFLAYLDDLYDTTNYTDLLDKWKKVMILKFCQNKSEEQKLTQIKHLLTEYPLAQLFPDQSKERQSSSKSSNSLVKSLMKSIESLEEPLNLSQQLMMRYRSDVNQKVEELQKRLLQKLDRIYKEQYHQTKSYYHLKTKLNFYKKVNVNMILMKMALMVQADQMI